MIDHTQEINIAHLPISAIAGHRFHFADHLKNPVLLPGMLACLKAHPISVVECQGKYHIISGNVAVEMIAQISGEDSCLIPCVVEKVEKI